MQLIHRWPFILAACFLLVGSSRAFTREVYVWQRQFSRAVYEAIELVKGDVDACAILAAEINWEAGQPRLFRSAANYKLLATAGRPVGLVLRIGPWAGKFASDDETARYLSGVVLALLKTARSDGLEPAELQVDFDCASSKLAGYRLWLEAVKPIAGPTKIVFTALPDWLGREDFPALARAADGYVLQVHSLEKPTGPDDDFQLCDPDRAWVWITQAGRVGLPFRVALPTYGYQLAFDADGRFIALSAEATPPAWPRGTQIRTVRSNATVVAELARKLATASPPACTGIIWFRLPVVGDRLNWDLSTLKVVLRGEVPRSQLAAEVVWLADGLAEVSLVNRGEQDESSPAMVQVRWTDDASVISLDGLNGYSPSSDRTRPGVVTLSVSQGAGDNRIAPERHCKIGWFRFSHEIPLVLQVISQP